MSEQIQNISDEILEYKDKIFIKIFSKALKENKTSFPENVAYYLNKLVANIGVSPNVVMLSSVIKVPSQTEANGGIPVSKAEVIAMDENNKKLFICDKNGNMIGKSITPTTFVTNNLKLIKASIK